MSAGSCRRRLYRRSIHKAAATHFLAEALEFRNWGNSADIYNNEWYDVVGPQKRIRKNVSKRADQLLTTLPRILRSIKIDRKNNQKNKATFHAVNEFDSFAN